MASQFDADPLPVHRLFEGRNTLYKIPEYQRPYSWEKRHIDQLWDDLYEAWDSNGNGDDSYFLGTIILVDNGDDRLDILDGQQRITTLIEGVIQLFSHRDDRASRIVSAFVVGDCDDEAKAQR